MKREVAEVCTLTNAHTCPPMNGSRVLALSRMGVLVHTTWNKDSITWCDAFMPYPRVPADVKKLMGDRYLVKGETE